MKAPSLLPLALLLTSLGCGSIQRKLLYYPTHVQPRMGLQPWYHGGTLIGYCRTVPFPRNVWILCHGTMGQASDRAYALPCFAPEDAVYVLEYPGYGSQKGRPSRVAIDRAAKEAYLLLRATYPGIPVCGVGESIGSGPISTLARLDPPPDKLVLLVPFDRLSRVARDHAPSLLVWMLLRDDWDNAEALAQFRGPVDIFGAEEDRIIPVAHARALAAALPTCRLVVLTGGHNEWAMGNRVAIRNP